MTDLFRKLNLKEGARMLVVDAPASFEAELAPLAGMEIRRDPASAASVDFSLCFVTKRADIDRLGPELARKTEGDAVLWFAYPKASSKNYACDFNRDSGWDALGALGFEAVRQIAIDADWSALRFRRTEYIKSLARTRLGALSDSGKSRLKGRGEPS